MFVYVFCYLGLCLCVLIKESCSCNIFWISFLGIDGFVVKIYFFLDNEKEWIVLYFFYIYGFVLVDSRFLLIKCLDLLVEKLYWCLLLR